MKHGVKERGVKEHVLKRTRPQKNTASKTLSGHAAVDEAATSR
jgi:hypothetical protein